MTRADLEAIPEDMRPPKAWPLVLFTVAALVLALAALYLAWGASGDAAAVERTTQATASRVDATVSARCRAARARITTEPETATERKLRELALSTFTSDCPKG